MLFFKNVEDNTILSDTAGLLPAHISTQEQLNEWEALNILNASKKHFAAKVKLIVSADWFKQVHRDMFCETWKWAGKFRKKDLNIGVSWYSISEQVKLLVDDIKYWQTGKGKFSIFQQSVRIHHRLVKIHPFVNGNGRHARLTADIFLYHHDEKLPDWPDKKLIDNSNVRKNYITALKAADNGDYSLLEKFIKGLVSNVTT